jgi:hypothetical protein
MTRRRGKLSSNKVNEMPKLLPLKDFRARRRVLTKEDFAWPGADISPQDPIDRETWEKLTTLPTDVSIETSDHNGTGLMNLYFLSSTWTEAIAVPIEGEPYPPEMLCAVHSLTRFLPTVRRLRSQRVGACCNRLRLRKSQAS